MVFKILDRSVQCSRNETWTESGFLHNDSHCRQRIMNLWKTYSLYIKLVALVASGVPSQVQAGMVIFTIHTHQCPDYLTDSVHPYSNDDSARYRLRSANGTNYSVPRTRTKFGDRAFSVAGPVVWNSLPVAVRHADSLHSFKRTLKSHFLACVLMIDSVMPCRSGFSHGGH